MSIISRPLQPPTQDNDTAVCVSNVCGRICRSSVGLYSHQLKTMTLQYVFPMCVVAYVDHQSASTATNSRQRHCSMCVQCVWSHMSIISRPLQPPTQDNDTAVCVCNVCGRICRSSVGLYSHQLKTTTLQYVCAMCVVGYVDHQSASTATNSFTENKLWGADKGAKCWDMRRNKASMKNMKTPVYHMGERVPVRYKLPKHKVQKKT